ncbi:MAG: beta-ketoacyl-ACP synthase II [Bacteroidetes bacterium]|nr:beta-ketoacyl-ACP synthase II [Rhodothermia bacterium]MCX7906042.1 beta-ketoacyl-ACP synthase II [Bacteroidota bacterium]MDW8285854.1 beta-ketoacyl-ACP synthase II [Bacteroidota bacterium]
MSSPRRRVVITGLGALTPIGLSVPDFWRGMLEGRSGAGPITYFDASQYDTRFACELKGFDPLEHLDRKTVRRLDPFCQYALVSAHEALLDSGLLEYRSLDKNRVGVVFGSGIGGIQIFTHQARVLFAEGPHRISPFFIPMLIPDIAPGQIAIRYGFKGPNYGAISACATATHNIGDAFKLIQMGYADVILCGGSEAAICELGVAGFNAMKALSTRNESPETASRPFDATRDGFVLGEGAGALVLEELGHALRRGARIYAEVVGIGYTADAYHITAPDPSGDGAARAMRAALEDAGIEPEEVDYINAHGTSTPFNDEIETRAIKTVFGEHAYRLNVSSTKSMIGHLLGAAGAVEAIATALAIYHSTIPPTINYTTPDPECDLDYTIRGPVVRDVRVALSNTFGFGGHNATLALRRFGS